MTCGSWSAAFQDRSRQFGLIQHCPAVRILLKRTLTIQEALHARPSLD